MVVLENQANLTEWRVIVSFPTNSSFVPHFSSHIDGPDIATLFAGLSRFRVRLLGYRIRFVDGRKDLVAVAFKHTVHLATGIIFRMPQNMINSMLTTGPHRIAQSTR